MFGRTYRFFLIVLTDTDAMAFTAVCLQELITYINRMSEFIYMFTVFDIFLFLAIQSMAEVAVF